MSVSVPGPLPSPIPALEAWWTEVLAPTRFKVAMGITVALAIGFVAWWLDVGRYHWEKKRWREVLPGTMWRSGQVHPGVIGPTLDAYDIDLVVDLDGGNEQRWDGRGEVREVRRRGLAHVQVDRLDGSGIGDPENYKQVLTSVRRAVVNGDRVWIHCAAGTQRTGAVMAMYRVLFEGWDGSRAFDEYLDVRGKADKGILFPFINKHLGEITDHLVEEGLLERRPDPLPEIGPAK